MKLSLPKFKVTQIGDTKIHRNLPRGKKTPGSVEGSVASVPPDPAPVEPHDTDMDELDSDMDEINPSLNFLYSCVDRAEQDERLSWPCQPSNDHPTAAKRQ